MNRTENKYYTKLCDNKKKSANGIGPVCSLFALGPTPRKNVPQMFALLEVPAHSCFLSVATHFVFPHNSSFTSALPSR